MLRFFFLLFSCFFAAASSSVRADTVRICYNYDCYAKADVTFSDTQLAGVRDLLKKAPDAAAEREALAQAMGRLYAIAGEQTPIKADRAGNSADAGVNGRMDCIDHSTTSDRFLHMIEAHGWLRFHRVIPIMERSTLLIFKHYSAAIEEIPAARNASVAAASAGQAGSRPSARFVVDSWFVNNGEPALVLPLDDWLDGAGPNVL